MSDVSEMLAEIEQSVDFIQKKLHESGLTEGECLANDTLSRCKDLLSTHVVIDKDCARYSKSVIDTYTENQVFTADQAGKLSWYKTQLQEGLTRIGDNNER